MLLAGIIVLALVVGAVLPLRWGLFGFLGAVCLVFALQAGIGIAQGFEGSSIEESLLLFNGSFAGYAGFKLLVAYRAFAAPLLVLAGVFVFRMGRVA